MTYKELEEFQDSTLKHIAAVSDMLKRLQISNQYIPCSDLCELLHTSLQKLNIYYRYVQLDYIIEKTKKRDDFYNES